MQFTELQIEFLICTVYVYFCVIVVIKALNPLALCIYFIHCIIRKYLSQKTHVIFDSSFFLLV